MALHDIVTSNQYQVCCITISDGDRIRLMACPAALVPAIRLGIQQNGAIIQTERVYFGSYEFKLKGYYFWGQGDDAVVCHRLLAGILTTMAKHGWNLLQSMGTIHGSLFFEPGTVDPEVSIFAVSFLNADLIRVIDAPDFMPYVKDAVNRFWPQGIKNEREYFGSLELKLQGEPWFHTTDQDPVNSKLLLSQIIANFRTAGYKLYTSIDMYFGRGNWNVESMVFRKIGDFWH